MLSKLSLPILTILLFSLHHITSVISNPVSSEELYESHLRKTRALEKRFGSRALRPRASPVVGSNERILLWGDELDHDDEVTTLDLPFEVQIYGKSSNTLYIGTNGLIGLDATNAWIYANQPLPFPDPNLYTAVFPFWDDLYVLGGTSQTIYMKLMSGTSFVLEYFVGLYGGASDRHHFSISYDALNPGKFQVRYYQVPSMGNSATVGMQGLTASDSTHYSQFSSQTPAITPGLLLTFDTTVGNGVITAGTFPL